VNRAQLVIERKTIASQDACTSQARQLIAFCLYPSRAVLATLDARRLFINQPQDAIARLPSPRLSSTSAGRLSRARQAPPVSNTRCDFLFTVFLLQESSRQTARSSRCAQIGTSCSNFSESALAMSGFSPRLHVRRIVFGQHTSCQPSHS
jgi:hypothetical protein